MRTSADESSSSTRSTGVQRENGMKAAAEVHAEERSVGPGRVVQTWKESPKQRFGLGDGASNGRRVGGRHPSIRKEGCPVVQYLACSTVQLLHIDQERTGGARHISRQAESASCRYIEPIDPSSYVRITHSPPLRTWSGVQMSARTSMYVRTHQVRTSILSDKYNKYPSISKYKMF